MLKKVLKENTFENQQNSQVDQAIYAFNEYVVSKDFTDFSVILQELNAPNWNVIIEKINSLWSKTYLNTIKALKSQSEIESHVKNFEFELKKIFSKRNDYTKWSAYYQHIINYELGRINNVNNGDNSKENHLIATQQAPAMTANSEYMEACKTASINTHSYDLEHILRCHSRDQNPQDNTTHVYDCAFEKCKVESGKYTNICATVGGPIINFVDVNTGHVVKRFVDSKLYNQSKEHFYRLEWTLIDNVSYLAAAGLHGDIKLINFDKSECVLRLDAHDKQIHSIMFHTKHSNILFSGSEDKTIKIWRLYVNADENTHDYILLGQIKYETSEKASRASREAVLSMCMLDPHYLIISTVSNNYYVHLDLDEMIQNFNDKSVLFEAKPLKFDFQVDLSKADDEIVANKVIAYKSQYLVMNIIYSSSIYIFEAQADPKRPNELSMQFYASVDFGVKSNWIFSDINLIEDSNRLFFLKPTEYGYFYKIEFDFALKKRKKVLKFKIPVNYKIRTSNKPTSASISIVTHGLLTEPKVYTCATNVDFIVATTDNNLVTIWAKNQDTCKPLE